MAKPVPFVSSPYFELGKRFVRSIDRSIDDPFDLDLMRWWGRENEASVVDITDESNLKFRCSLMTLTLPVSIVALKILES